MWVAPLAEVADDPAGTGRRAIEQLAGHVDRWWLHIDLDVLDPAEFPAQGLPDVEDEPGGLTWDQLTDLVMALFGSLGALRRRQPRDLRPGPGPRPHAARRRSWSSYETHWPARQ